MTIFFLIVESFLDFLKKFRYHCFSVIFAYVQLKVYFILLKYYYIFYIICNNILIIFYRQMDRQTDRLFFYNNTFFIVLSKWGEMSLFDSI